MNTVEEFINKLYSDEELKKLIAYKKEIPARKAKFAELDPPLPDQLLAGLGHLGVKKLYTHQIEAIRNARNGINQIITTLTASGKSLCYNVPVIERVLANPKARAIYVFPTKALSQDQLKKLLDLQIADIFPATYDGDTPSSERPFIRKNANIVLTNPDMLHFGILPFHRGWASMFFNLHFVIIDEVHISRGIFGSNVANVLRRLDRICEHYGSNPVFILTSATIRNAREHAQRLSNRQTVEVKKDGSPQGKRNFIFLNPPLINRETGKRQSSNTISSNLFADLVQRGIRTIVFTKSKKSVELILSYTRDSLKMTASHLIRKIASYRSGYLPEDRREVERKLFEGKLLGVSSTNALELGVDIGGLDVSVMDGYPGTVASTWQEAGRAGRAGSPSLAILIAGEDLLDQYWMRNPEDFFAKTPEEAIVEPSRPIILRNHLACAAQEIPLTAKDEPFFGKKFKEEVSNLTRSGDLIERKGRWYWVGKGSPHLRLNIRSASQDNYSIVEVKTGLLLGTLESSIAFSHLHPGSIYLHQARSYLVVELKIKEKVALVRETKANYYTQPKKYTEITITDKIEDKRFGSNVFNFGKVEVSTQLLAYQKRKIFTGEVLGIYELDMPVETLQTEALWFEVPEHVISPLNLSKYETLGSLHAVEHSSIGVLPLLAMCDRWDVGGVSTDFHPQTEGATIFIYDGYPGGIGIVKTAYERMDELLSRTLKTVERCSCQKGCPSCIQSPKCGNWNEPLNKAGAIAILTKLLSRDSGRGTRDRDEAIQ